MQDIQTLIAKAEELTHLSDVISLLNWDQETYLAPQAHEDRAEQIALLTKIHHEKSTSPDLGELLEVVSKTNLDQEWHASLVRVMNRNYELATKLDKEMVEQESRLTSLGLMAWTKAREENKFEHFSKIFSELLALNLEKTKRYGFIDHPYSALVDLYAEGVTVNHIDTVFAELKGELPLLIKSIQEKQTKENSRFLGSDPGALVLPVVEQKALVKFLLTEIGYDWERGREDEVRHPFQTRVAAHDMRVTNKYIEDNVFAIFAAFHEGGHALYELGIDDKYGDTPLATTHSLAIHESQSRFWENIVGRSLAFWECRWDRVVELAPSLKSLSPKAFLQKTAHRITPSLIRIEADEVTYDIHIAIRYTIEKQLIEGSLALSDVPEVWAEMYEQLLGVRPKNLKEGCLQDVHWSMGSLGYFPTYTLGNVYAAMIEVKMESELGGLDGLISGKGFPAILSWLKQNIHQHGAVLTPLKLMNRVVGSGFNVQNHLDRLKARYL